MSQALPRVGRLVARVAEVVLRDDSQGSNGRERAAVVAVQVVSVVAVDYQFTIGTPRQFQAVDERVTRVTVAWIAIALAGVIQHVARVIVGRRSTELDPMFLDVTRIVIV